ncbi:hypothetical protein SAY87_003824 [Trapa incisa]|uniref:TPR repeat-containing protein n=1 Tax=Trapa incisa TaxID=236973 RepID=A0AAN7KQ05_9MYRT|nr:hypothetical protein SAY87_003824 [Trapa incisa]
MGEDERAIEVFQKAIDLNPGHVDALYNLGGLYMDLGRFQRASEMYARVLAVWPSHWRAQLNKAVSLLGAEEAGEAKKAMKEALKMTNRVELHDAIAHLKQLQKKKVKGNGAADGEGAFIIIEASKFKTLSEKTTLRQDLASALQIRVFQRVTRLSKCDVELLKKEMRDNDVPVSYSGTGVPQKSVRKPNLEQILRRLLHFLKPEAFQGAVKAINERILSVLDRTGSGRVDMGMFYAILAPICIGQPEKRKRVAYDALLWRSVNDDGAGPSQIRKVDALDYIRLLRAIYLPTGGSSELHEVQGEMDISLISFSVFLVMFDDRDWGFGILSTLMKLETGDRNRHGDHICSVCRYPIIGSRFKETKSCFSLCSQCYCEGKVPPTLKQEEYRFGECISESEAMKEKCGCFTVQSNAAT